MAFHSSFHTQNFTLDFAVSRNRTVSNRYQTRITIHHTSLWLVLVRIYNVRTNGNSGILSTRKIADSSSGVWISFCDVWS
jgi:hypothetical protein